MKHTWTVDAEHAGNRLDIFLSGQFPDKTRSSLAKLLKQDAATVNGKKASVHRFLKEGDKIVFEDTPVRPNTTQKTSTSLRSKAPVSKLDIIDETPDWIVINKPEGILVHPDSVERDETLVDALVAHTPEMAKIGEDPSRPGIMHRLDKDVSGLMVIAKTQNAFDNLKRQFAEHSVDKRYLALVHGVLPSDEGDIKLRIARSKTKARMAARPEHEKTGKAAWTHYKVIKRFDGATLVELSILSGRTHQIRAHMHGIGHPVMGDSLYILRQTDRNITTPRLLLQSISLSFNDPATGTRKHYSLPADPTFDLVMKTFKPALPPPTATI